MDTDSVPQSQLSPRYPNPIQHVKRPVEQFERFDEERFPRSEFTMEGTMDSVRYHSLYNGFRPIGDGTQDDPVDLTTQEDQIFYPPEGEEWFVSPSEAGKYATTNESAIEPRGSCDIKDPFNLKNMRPYLSPKTLSPEEVKEREQEYSSWREYLSVSTNSLDQWQESNANLQYEAAGTIQPFDETPKTRRSVCSSMPGQGPNQDATIITVQPVQPSTYRDAAVKPSSSTSSATLYVIPKKGVQSNKLNELAIKVFPPARPILPKPPGMTRESPPRNISGNRSIQGQRKKKKMGDG